MVKKNSAGNEEVIKKKSLVEDDLTYSVTESELKQIEVQKGLKAL